MEIYVQVMCRFGGDIVGAKPTMLASLKPALTDDKSTKKKILQISN